LHKNAKISIAWQEQHVYFDGAKKICTLLLRVIQYVSHGKGGAHILFNTHVKAVRDLRNNYSEVAKIVRNHDHVIITNNGKSEAVLIPYEEFEKYEEYLHIRYVKEKLAEAEAAAGNPDEWMGADELFKEWDSWDAVTI
jgi:prevent-host-death family protein